MKYKQDTYRYSFMWPNEIVRCIKNRWEITTERQAAYTLYKKSEIVRATKLDIFIDISALNGQLLKIIIGE